MAPPKLAPRLRSLPPILYMKEPHPMTGYSKAPRGLSVQLRVVSVFTDTTTSPSPWSRQRSSRYTIRAGRNLPDKEFRLNLTQRSPLSGGCGHIPPACRHAVGTISSSDVSDVRRMASEDSDQLASGFLAVHRLSDLRDLSQPVSSQMPLRFDPLYTLCELLEVSLLRGSHRMPAEKRDDHRQQIGAPSHNVPI